MSYPPQGNLAPQIETAEIADNQVTDAKIATHASTKITGLPAQTQTLDMGTNLIDNVSDIATGIISDETNTVSSITITDTSGLITINQNMTFDDAVNIAFNTTTGTQIGTASTQKLGFFGATPIVQEAHIADPSGGATIDAEARTAINAILADLAAYGLQASA